MPSLPEVEVSRHLRCQSFDGPLPFPQPLHSPPPLSEGEGSVEVFRRSGRRAHSLDFSVPRPYVVEPKKALLLPPPLLTMDEGEEGGGTTGRSLTPSLKSKGLRTGGEEEKSDELTEKHRQPSPSSPSASPSLSSSPPSPSSSPPPSTSPSHPSSYRAAVPHPTRSFSPSALSIVDIPHDLRHLHLRRAVEERHLPAFPYPPSCCVLGPSQERQPEDVVLRDQWTRLLMEQRGMGIGGTAVSGGEMRRLVWGGVPPSLRGEVWSCWLKGRFPHSDMAGYMEGLWLQVEAIQAAAAHAASQPLHSPSPFPSIAFPAPSPLWSAFADIEKDVSRTLPSQWLFRTKEGVASLRRLLLCFAVHCPVVGYCQGLNFIAGSVLLVTRGEEVAAFSLLCAIVEGRMGYYTKSMAGCMVDTAVMADLAAFYEPEMMALLNHYGLPLNTFCASWFICLYCTAPLHLSHAMRVWDVLFCLGEEVLFRLGLALLRHAHSRLLSISGAEELMQLFLQRMGEMDSIEPVLSFIQQQWVEEPHLHQSIAALRDFHRFEVTATQSSLNSATVCRLQEQTSFDSAELQRLWELFIQPDPWQTINSGCIASLVHFRYSFCAAVFHPNASNQFKGRGLIIQPQPPKQRREEEETGEAEDEEGQGKAKADSDATAASTAPPLRRRLFASTAGAVPSSSPLPSPSDLLSPAPSTWSSTATISSSTSPFLNRANDGRGEEEKGRTKREEGEGEGGGEIHPMPLPSPSSPRPQSSIGLSLSLSTSTSTSSSSSFPPPPSPLPLSCPPLKSALANHSSHFQFPSVVGDCGDSIFASSEASASATSTFGPSTASSASSLFPSSTPSQAPLFPSLSSTQMSPFPCPSSTVPLSSPPSSPTGGRPQNGKGKGKDRGGDSWASTWMGGGGGLGPSLSSTPHSPSTASLPSPRRPPPRLTLQLPASFSAHRAIQRSNAASSSSPSSAHHWTIPRPSPLSHSSSLAAPALPHPFVPVFSATAPVPSTSSSSPPLPLLLPHPSPSEATAACPSPSPSPSPSPLWFCGSVDGSGVGSVMGQWSVLGRLFVMLDGLGRGCVDFDEFCVGVWLLKKSPREVRLRAIFSMADVGGEGQMTREELRQFIGLFDSLYQGKRNSGGSERDIAAFVERAFDTAKPSNLLNCSQFAQIAHLHPHIAHFFRL